MTTFRRAKESDLERLVEIHLAAYPDPCSIDVRMRNFTHHPFGGLERLVVVEDDAGRPVGHAFLFPLEASFGGAKVKVGGIASVAVAPEARGRGIATALMRRLHALSDRRGDAVTMLHPSRQGFYARLGYATTSSRKRLAIATRSVPEPWRALARARVRAATGGDERALYRLHARAAERATGWIARPKRCWELFIARERRILLVCEGPRARPAGGASATGYVAFTLAQEQLRAETRLEVDELVADDDEARRALVGALAAMRDQATEIVLEVAEADPLERALVDPDGRRFGTSGVEHALGEIVGGPMVRIEDPSRALAARGYAGSGAFDVVVREPGGDDGVALGLCVRGGRAEVGPARGRRRGALQTTRAGLAAIFYGALSVTDAVALGMAEAPPEVAASLDAVVKMPPLAPVDAF